MDIQAETTIITTTKITERQRAGERQWKEQMDMDRSNNICDVYFSYIVHVTIVKAYVTKIKRSLHAITKLFRPNRIQHKICKFIWYR